MSKTTVHLIRRPLEVIRPERRTPEINWVRNGPTDAIHWDENCPPSYLTTLQQVNGDKLRGDENPEAKFETELAEELPGVNLRKALWTIESPKKGVAAESKVVFSCLVPKYNLTITKTYELEKVPAGGDAHSDVAGLPPQLERGDRQQRHEEARRRLSPGRPQRPAGGGLVVRFREGKPQVVHHRRAARRGLPVVRRRSRRRHLLGTRRYEGPLSPRNRRGVGIRPAPAAFFGVDAQYFSVAMLPDAKSTAPNIERAIVLRVGNIAEERRTLTNTSFRLIGKPIAIEPGKTAETQRYVVFSGPEAAGTAEELRAFRPDLLRPVDLPHGRRAADRGAGQFLLVQPQLRAGDHHVDDRRPPVHVSAQPQKCEERSDHAEAAAGNQGDPEAATRRTPRRFARPRWSFSASTTITRRPAVCQCYPIAGFHGPVSRFAGKRRTPGRPIDIVRRPLVLEPCRPRHALRLESVHARGRQQRHCGDFTAWAPT